MAANTECNNNKSGILINDVSSDEYEDVVPNYKSQDNKMVSVGDTVNAQSVTSIPGSSLHTTENNADDDNNGRERFNDDFMADYVEVEDERAAIHYHVHQARYRQLSENQLTRFSSISVIKESSRSRNRAAYQFHQ